MSAVEILQAALTLSSEQRADVATQLLLSLDGAHEEEDAADAWRTEVDARLSLAEQGQLESLDFRESIKWLRASLATPSR